MKVKAVAHILKGVLVVEQEKDTTKKYRVAAATLSSSGSLVAYGTNSYVKTHPLMKRYAYEDRDQYRLYIHAELSALVKSKGKVNEIVVVRLLRDGSYANAKPCRICEAAIREAGIKKVYYTTDSGEINCMRMN